jgi:DNA replication protein DnaC
MKQKTAQHLRTTAQKLSDIRRGESRQRRQAHQDDAQKYADIDQEIQRRWQHDRDALLAEYTWTCPYCGNVLDPVVHVRDARPPIGRWIPAVEERVSIHRRQACGCRGESAILQAEAERETEVDRWQWASRLKQAGLVGWLASATFDAYQVETDQQALQKRVAREYAKTLLGGGLGDCCWLICYGPLGLGKTHLAASIVHAALSAGWDRCYLRVWPQWIESLQASWDRDSDLSTSALVKELQSGKLVVMDDIDKAKPSEWMKEKLYTALNHRYNANLPTVLTFNHGPKEMVPWLGGPLIDRMMERLFNVVQFAGQSYRSPLDLPY